MTDEDANAAEATEGVSACDQRPHRVDLSVIGVWIVDRAFLDSPHYSPQHAWLDSVAEDFGMSPATVRALLHEVAAGWSIRTALDRSGLAPHLWNRGVDLLQRLVLAGVVARANLREPGFGRAAVSGVSDV